MGEQTQWVARRVYRKVATGDEVALLATAGRFAIEILPQLDGVAVTDDVGSSPPRDAGPIGPGRSPEPARAPRTGQTAQPQAARASSDTTTQTVLHALTGGEALTASQIAQNTGIARPTVCTTLAALIKIGEVVKAARGYQLRTSTPPEPEAQDAPAN